MPNIFYRFIKFLGMLILMLLVFTVPALWSLGHVLWYKNHPVNFDQLTWQEAEKETHANTTYVRLQMASNLIQSGALINKDEPDVIKLLGKPQNHPAISGTAYWLSPNGLDSMWLQIIYEKGIVKNVAIVGD